MAQLSRIGHELALAARVGARTLGRRLRGELSKAPDTQAYLRDCATWLDQADSSALRDSAQIRLPADQPPWLDTGVDLEAGEQVTWLARGRVYLSRALDIWVAPRFQLWARVGPQGTVFAGTRDTHSFTSQEAGRLYLASYFPGEWADESGALATDPKEYSKASGGIAVQLLRWRADADPKQALADLALKPGAPPEAEAELARQNSYNNVPTNWSYLWFLGQAEIYQSKHKDTGGGAIACHTHGDVGILRTELDLPLTPDTQLHWDWRVDQLPSDLAEDTLPTHDYLSIAIEFDNGQDITWHWSAQLPAETIYRCPLPTWKHRETHIVIRSGSEGLGQWLSESRNVHQDCINALGAPAARIVRVWLIANSLFQRQPGNCEYRNIKVTSDGKDYAI